MELSAVKVKVRDDEHEKERRGYYEEGKLKRAQRDRAEMSRHRNEGRRGLEGG